MNPFNSRWSLRCAQGVTLAAALVTAPLVAHAQASALTNPSKSANGR